MYTIRETFRPKKVSALISVAVNQEAAPVARSFLACNAAAHPISAPSGIQERDDLASKAISIFHVREMCAIEFDVARALNVVGEEVSVGKCRGGVMSSGNDETRNVNFAELFARVEVADSCAVRGVTLGAGAFHDALNVCDDGAILRTKRRCEPALDSGGSNVLHSFFADGIDASVPHFVS